MHEVGARIEDRRAELTPAERRVAEALLADPRAVAFGTVAELATRAGTSGASVVRLATRLGYDGFVGMQAAVQGAMEQRLAPAAERIREPAARDVIGRTMARELDNVRRTLESIDRGDFERAVALLAGSERDLYVLAGDAEDGIGGMLAAGLDLLRPGVTQVRGSDAAVARQLASLRAGDVVIALDLLRYERWVLDHAGAAVDRGAVLIAITDGLLSPLTDVAALSFVVLAAGAGPFDSHVGTLALANALITGVAAKLRRTATRRLDKVEAAWTASGALVH